MLQEIVDKRFGDFSACPEAHVNSWKNRVLSGNVNQLLLALGRIKGDVQSRLSIEYRVIKKCELLLKDIVIC